MTVAIRPTAKTRTSQPPKRQALRVVGLFAGVGGLELGLKAAGHETLGFCELDSAAQAVLDARFNEIHFDSDVLETSISSFDDFGTADGDVRCNKS